jgi:molybdopterin molybdotransferase
VGDHDLVKPALVAAGADLDFWRIAMRPGKPLLAGRIGKSVCIGLPGNPVSAFVTATLFLLPMIARLGGASVPVPESRHAILATDLPSGGSRAEYLRARIVDGRVDPIFSHDSALLAILASANALIVRPADAPTSRAGEIVEIIAIA